LNRQKTRNEFEHNLTKLYNAVKDQVQIPNFPGDTRHMLLIAYILW